MAGKQQETAAAPVQSAPCARFVLIGQSLKDLTDSGAYPGGICAMAGASKTKPVCGSLDDPGRDQCDLRERSNDGPHPRSFKRGSVV